jgi:hypothetical protein
MTDTNGFEGRLRALLEQEVEDRRAAVQHPGRVVLGSSRPARRQSRRWLVPTLTVGFVAAVTAAAVAVPALSGGTAPSLRTSSTTTSPSTTTNMPVTTTVPPATGNAFLTCANATISRTPQVTVTAGGYTLAASLGPPEGSGPPFFYEHESASLTHEGHRLGLLSYPDVFNFLPLGTSLGVACLARQHSAGNLIGLVGLDNGNGHETTVLQVFYEDKTGRPRQTQLVFDQATLQSPDLMESNGHLVIVGSDGRFDYRWASYGFSDPPILVQEFQDGRLLDVTDEYPSLVRQDAAANWAEAHTPQVVQSGQQDGLYAAWAADECRLESTAKVWSELNTLADSGVLTGDLQGKQFVADLERQLVSWDICSPLR